METLKELAKKEFSKHHIKKDQRFIVVVETDDDGNLIYKKDENGNDIPFIPEYADELIETHGHLAVENWLFSERNQMLIVEFLANQY